MTTASASNRSQSLNQGRVKSKGLAAFWLVVLLAVLPAPARGLANTAALLTQIKILVGEARKQAQVMTDIKNQGKTAEDQLSQLVQIQTAQSVQLASIESTIIASARRLEQTLTQQQAALAEADLMMDNDQRFARQVARTPGQAALERIVCAREQGARVTEPLSTGAYDLEDQPGAAVPVLLAEDYHDDTALLRRPAGSSEHLAVLDSISPRLASGGHLSESAALTQDEYRQLADTVWTLSPGTPLSGRSERTENGLRFGAARQIMALWHANLAPVNGWSLPGADPADRLEDLFDQYPPEALAYRQVRLDDGREMTFVPAHSRLRAEALSPWMGAAPGMPRETASGIEIPYSMWLGSQGAEALAREQIRLSVIQNRLLYELLVWNRQHALLAAVRDLSGTG